MKKIIIISALSFLSFGAFAQKMSPPASTQKVQNTTLTCPTKKWCKVLVNVSLYPRAYTSQGTITNYSADPPYMNASEVKNVVSDTFEVVLKSADTINCTATNLADNVNSVANTVWYFYPFIQCTISGSIIYKAHGAMAITIGGTITSVDVLARAISNYTFYSQEYFN